MSFWSVESIKSVLAASFLVRAKPPSKVLADRVCIDSRTIFPGCVFIAIKGDRTDGHQYVQAAAQGGAHLLIVHDPASISGVEIPAGINVLQVADTGAALLKLAAAYRRTLDATRVIAVGGSNGKTTTCNLLSGTLSPHMRGTASPKSFNNAIGVPLTILSARRGDQYLICEVGTNAPGEILPLSTVIEPDIAVITSIGREHLEGLGSIAGVVAEEANLLSGLRPGGTAIVTADSAQLLEVVRPLIQQRSAGSSKPCSLVTFGRSVHADLRVGDIDVGAEATSFTINQRERYRVQLPGTHNASNAAAVIAVARRMGLKNPDIERSLAAARGPDMRMQRTSIGGVHFINDAYNANPDSTLAAIETYHLAFSGTSGVSRRVLVLGDMLELGTEGAALHHEMGLAIAAAGCFDLVVLVGPLSQHAAQPLQGRNIPTHLAEDATDSNASVIAQMLQPGDCVLLKGSRGTGLERILTAFAARLGSIIEHRPPTGLPTAK